MRRHIRWAVLLAAVPLSALGCWLLLVWSATRTPPQSALFTAALIVGVALPIVLLVLSVRAMVRTHRRARHRRGRFTPFEQAQRARADDAVVAWNRAGRVRRMVIDHVVPPSVATWDVVPLPGEVFFGCVGLRYARYYGQTVSYTQHGGVSLGRPGFVLGALAITAAANAAARSSAARQAAPQWREWQTSRVWITNRRLVVEVGGRWLTFAYDAMTAVYPEAAARTLVCQFDGVEPMLLTGHDAPFAAVFTVLSTLGPDAVASHPGLLALDVPAAPAQLYEVAGGETSGRPGT